MDSDWLLMHFENDSNSIISLCRYSLWCGLVLLLYLEPFLELYLCRYIYIYCSWCEWAFSLSSLKG